MIISVADQKNTCIYPGIGILDLKLLRRKNFILPLVGQCPVTAVCVEIYILQGTCVPIPSFPGPISNLFFVVRGVWRVLQMSTEEQHRWRTSLNDLRISLLFPWITFCHNKIQKYKCRTDDATEKWNQEPTDSN